MANQNVLLESILLPDSSLRHRVAKGLGAFKAKDKNLILESERAKAGDSLDLDEAARAQFPEANRWDYLVSVPSKSYLIAIEPHSAKDSEVTSVIKKKQHAIRYLRDHLPAKHRVARWLWISHARVAFSRMDKAIRLLDQHGILFVGRILKDL